MKRKDVFGLGVFALLTSLYRIMFSNFLVDRVDTMSLFGLCRHAGDDSAMQAVYKKGWKYTLLSGPFIHSVPFPLSNFVFLLIFVLQNKKFTHGLFVLASMPEMKLLFRSFPLLVSSLC